MLFQAQNSVFVGNRFWRSPGSLSLNCCLHLNLLLRLGISGQDNFPVQYTTVFFSFQYISELSFLELFRQINVPKHNVSLKSFDPRDKFFSSNVLLKVVFLLIIGFMRSSAEIMQHLSPRFLRFIEKVHLSQKLFILILMECHILNQKLVSNCPGNSVVSHCLVLNRSCNCCVLQYGYMIYVFISLVF